MMSLVRSPLRAALGLALVTATGLVPLGPLAAGPARADDALGRKKTVRVTGWADVTGDDVAAARDAAIRDAHKRAIEQVAGVHVKSVMKDEAVAALKDDVSTVEQRIQQQVLTRSEGFVVGQKIVSERREGKSFKVELELMVDDAELGRRIAVIGKKLAGVRFPKLMFVAKESYKGRDGKTIEVTEPTLAALLEDALIARGFDLVSKDAVDTLRRDELEVFEASLADDKKAAEVAMRYGAEYVITAVARVEHTSYDDLRQKEHHGFADLSLKAINASSAGIVASTKKSGNAPADCFSEAELRTKAVRHVTPPLLENLLGRLMESWETESKRGVRYTVKLYGVTSYRAQGLAFIDKLQKVPEVKDVKKLSFGGGRLELEVFYPSTKDVSALEAAVLEAIGADPAFSTLDVTYSRGRELNFKL